MSDPEENEITILELVRDVYAAAWGTGWELATANYPHIPSEQTDFDNFKDSEIYQQALKMYEDSKTI